MSQSEPVVNDASIPVDASLLARLQQRLEDAAEVANWVGHDFANVLTGVLGFAELALSQLPPKSEVHEFIREIQQAAERGNRLISKLLLFARRQRMHGGTTALPDFVAENESRWQGLIGAEHTLSFDMPADLPAVSMAPELLRHLVEPLLINARQALDQPGKITVAARRRELSAAECGQLLGRATPGAFVELAVADTGPGFSPQARQQWLTRPFFSTRPRHHGLGLPMVYGICYTHGGGFRIEGSESHGTWVRIFLPTCRLAGT